MAERPLAGDGGDPVHEYPSDYSMTNADESVHTDTPDPTTGTPRWVKVLAVIGIVLVLLVIVMLATGRHGPGRHMDGGLGGYHAAHGTDV